MTELSLTVRTLTAICSKVFLSLIIIIILLCLQVLSKLLCKKYSLYCSFDTQLVPGGVFINSNSNKKKGVNLEFGLFGNTVGTSRVSKNFEQ
jgi:hypothetical protein